MVPNSLGPGELLMQFGTKEQRDHWLPRLADGREIPCFGLTSPEAGSDAASMIDIGVVCHGRYDGRETLGIRLNWHKRYITLGPVATVLGLAFKLHDPDHLIGEVEEPGITVALIPTDAPGVEIGRRHLPSMQIFQNGPNKGNDVFVPLDAIIGGPERAGQGWQMLMSALAAGRGISLPSLSAAGAAFSAHTSGAYARLRSQFGIPVGRFEGIQEPLARIAGTAYTLDAARRLTCAGLDQGHKPSVISAIMKSQATERMRASVNDAMDIHAGKAVIDGPLNYMGSLYRSLPVAITVEGANILTRSLIVFGQGAIRSHPFLLKEMLALGDENEARGVDQFDRFFWQHLRHGLVTAGRALGRALTSGRFAPVPSAGETAHFYGRLGRYSAAFALTADMALLTLGGSLKRKEMLSGRLGDIFSELYLLSAVLKRWEDEGRQEDDFSLVAWCMETGFATIEKRLDEIFTNLPNRPAAWLLRLFTLPFGAKIDGPTDETTQACAEILLTPSTARDRLTSGIFHGPGHEGLNRLDAAFALLADTQAVAIRMRKAGIDDSQEAQKRGIITAEEARQLVLAAEAAAKVVEVDDFAPEDLSPRLDDKNRQEIPEATRHSRRGFN
jgi:acyl-CoA dehydrogenase